jgi:S-phase kinase-associated protein 1
MSETEMMKPYLWLQTGDDSIQQVEQDIAMICPFIRQKITSQNGMGSSKNCPLCLPEQVRTPALLNSILNYCRFHQTPGRSNKERKSYNEKLIKIMDTNGLCELASAANSLRLNPLVNLICCALAQLIKVSSPEEVRNLFHMPDDLTEEEKLESLRNVTCDTSIRLFKRLCAHKRKVLKEREMVLENYHLQHTNADVVDERSVDELLLFINGSNDEEPKRNKTCKNKKKKRRKEKEQQKKSSLKEAAVQDNKKEEDDPIIEFNDDEFDQTIMAKIDREVEEFERRLNTDWSERIKEFFERC